MASDKYTDYSKIYSNISYNEIDNLYYEHENRIFNDTTSILKYENRVSKESGNDYLDCKKYALYNDLPFFFTKDSQCYFPNISDISLDDYRDRFSKLNNKLVNFQNETQQSNNNNNSYKLYRLKNIEQGTLDINIETVKSIFNKAQKANIKCDESYQDISGIVERLDPLMSRYNFRKNINEIQERLPDLSYNFYNDLQSINDNLKNLIEFKSKHFNETKAIDTIIEEKRHKLEQLLQLDGGNNGRLDDIRYNKSIITSECIILSLIVIMAFITYTKVKDKI
tara:strand:- start:6660 stop:7502 length:843 start_codon:yes stop_codon:yes gene_type:complete